MLKRVCGFRNSATRKQTLPDRHHHQAKRPASKHRREIICPNIVTSTIIGKMRCCCCCCCTAIKKIDVARGVYVTARAAPRNVNQVKRAWDTTSTSQWNRSIKKPTALRVSCPGAETELVAHTARLFKFNTFLSFTLEKVRRRVCPDSASALCSPIAPKHQRCGL